MEESKELLNYIFDDLKDYRGQNSGKAYALVAIDKDDVDNGKEYISVDEVIGDIMFDEDVDKITEYIEQRNEQIAKSIANKTSHIMNSKCNFQN